MIIESSVILGVHFLVILGRHCTNYENEKGLETPATSWRSLDPTIIKIQATCSCNQSM